MLEKEIEQALCQAVRDRGGMAIKMTSPGTAGLPDRLILLPNGNMAFVEVKAPGKHMRPVQFHRKRQLEAFGFTVYCLDRVEKIGGILDEVYPA